MPTQEPLSPEFIEKLIDFVKGNAYHLEPSSDRSLKMTCMGCHAVGKRGKNLVHVSGCVVDQVMTDTAILNNS